MNKQLACSRGHRWEVPLDGRFPAAVGGMLCPKCGAAAETVPPQDSVPLATPVSQPATPSRSLALVATAWPVVPGYEILDELGRGGMGVVYKARQVGLKRTVALKMILGGGRAGAEELARFRTEAEAVARLQHLNIVQIYEVGDHAGLPYFSLEFVDGGSLAQKLAGQPQPARYAAALVQALARAIHAAHEAGVIHRDLKPANVLLTKPGTPKITDFGLAKKLEDDSGQTRTGAIMGTPSYMAPEQASGHTRAIGPAVDVYALGAILYELLTGRPPFKGATVLETLEQVRTREPEPPRWRQPKVPLDLQTVCLKCLEKEPQRRYASAAELADDLRRFLAHEPIRARPLGRLERAGRWAYRRRAALVTAAGAVVAVAVSAVAGAWYVAATTQQPEPPQAPAGPPETRRYPGHKGWVFAVAFSKDGAKALSGGGGEYGSHGETLVTDSTARLWDLDTGKELRRFEGHQGPVVGVAFGPDETRVFSAALDNTIREWDAATGKELRQFPIQTKTYFKNAFTPVSFAPGGRRALACISHTAVLWDVETGKKLKEFKGHQQDVIANGLAADGRRAITGGKDGVVLVWDAESDKPLRRLNGHPKPVRAVALSADGKLALTAAADETLQLWDVDSGGPARVLKGDTTYITCLAFSPDGGRAIVGGIALGRLWDLKIGAELFRLEGHIGPLAAGVFDREGRHALTASQDTTFRYWDLEMGREVCSFGQNRHIVSGLAAEGLASLDREGNYPESNADREGIAHAKKGEWEAAARAFARSVEGDQTNPLAWCHSGMAYLALGRGDDYRRTCQATLNRFENDPDPMTLNLIVQLCILGPNAVSKPQRLVATMERAISTGGRNAHHVVVLGEAHCRAGQPAQAIACFDEVSKVQGEGPVQWLYRALAQHRLGNVREAHELREKALAEVRDGYPWESKLAIDLLAEEVERLLKGMAAP